VTARRTSFLLPAAIVLVAASYAATAAEDHGAGASHAATPAGDSAKPPAENEAPALKLWPDVPAVEQDRQPYILMRTLRSVQDEVATGSATAHELQKNLMHDFGEQMRGLPAAVWDDIRNVRAAIFFVLSGGDPAVVKAAIDRAKVPISERRLLKGAMAYGEGRFVDSLGIIHKVDARKIDASLGGIVALIQGTLITKKDQKKAIAFFDDARLLAPGTLVEEAALRQEILLLAREGDLKRFDFLTAQYSRRFGGSLFARNFRRQFFAGVARQDFKRATDWISRTETELQKAPPSERVGLYLAIAEQATKGGNIDIARYAAGKAKDLAQAGSPELARAQLYEGAAMVATADFEAGLALLGEADLSLLRASDREIHKAALAVAQSVGRWPQVTAELTEPLPESVTRAEAQLSNVDALLGGKVQ
jgi:chemotaxis protein MotC